MPSRQVVSWAKFRVTMVIVCALTILSVLIYLLTGGTLLQAKTTLFLYLPDATGVAPASPVRVDGIDVGKVQSVRLTGSMDPNRVVVLTMTVEESRRRSIPADSWAQLSADTLVGDQYVDITTGRSASYVQPNGEIRYQPQTDIMKSLDLVEFQRRLRQIDAVLTDIEQGKGQVGQFFQGEEMYNDLRHSLAELERGMRRALTTTGRVGAVLFRDELYRKTEDSVRRFDEALARIQSGQGQAGQLLRDTGDYERLRQGAVDLRRRVEEVRSSPLVAGDALYARLTGTVAQWITAVDQANAAPALKTSEAYDNLEGAAREMRDTLRDFRTAPKKYLRLKVF